MPGHDPNTNKYTKLFDLTLVLLFLGTLGVILFESIFFIIFPKMPILFNSILPRGAPIMFHFPLLIFHMYTILILYMSTFTIVLGSINYGVLVVPFVVRELRLGRKKYRSLSKLREQETLIMEYRGAEILQKIFNNLVGRFLLVFQTLVTLMFKICGFMVIKHGKDMDAVPFVLMLVWGICAPVAWGTWLLACSYFNSHSLKILNSWKHHAWKRNMEKIIMDKFRASCKPLAVSYETMYIIRTRTVLLFLRSLIRGLMRTLLALRTE